MTARTENFFAQGRNAKGFAFGAADYLYQQYFAVVALCESFSCRVRFDVAVLAVL